MAIRLSRVRGAVLLSAALIRCAGSEDGTAESTDTPRRHRAGGSAGTPATNASRSRGSGRQLRSGGSVWRRRIFFGRRRGGRQRRGDPSEGRQCRSDRLQEHLHARRGSTVRGRELVSALRHGRRVPRLERRHRLPHGSSLLGRTMRSSPDVQARRSLQLRQRNGVRRRAGSQKRLVVLQLDALRSAAK